MSVTISNKGTGGTNTARTSPKGGHGGKQNYDDTIREDHDETADYAEVQDTDTVEDRPGRLKMQDVKQLSDDPDQVIDTLKNVDLGMQELDVLIELARQLKQKREALFPDSGSILNSELFQTAS